MSQKRRVKVISSNRLGEKGMGRSELLGQRKYETDSKSVVTFSARFMRWTTIQGYRRQR